MELEGTIQSIEVKHYGFRKGYEYRSLARMSLWAITEAGHRVWLEKKEGLEELGHNKIEEKVQKYHEERKAYVGKKIKYEYDEYKKIGFIREISGVKLYKERINKRYLPAIIKSILYCGGKRNLP